MGDQELPQPLALGGSLISMEPPCQHLQVLMVSQYGVLGNGVKGNGVLVCEGQWCVSM